jgi:hypothetical protein
MAMATTFRGDGRYPVALAGEDYFAGPGEESRSPLAPGDEPDTWWDAPEGWPAVDPDAGFGPGGSAEVMLPGVLLHMRVEQAVADGMTGMSDDAVVGMAAAARRLRSRAEWLEIKATEEFARRRWDSGPVPERDKDGRWLSNSRAAEFAPDELAFHLADSPLAAQERMDLSLTLRDRLPLMAAQLAAGRGDAHRCQIVHDATGHLSDSHARQVDAELAPEAPGLRYDALRRRARKLAMMLDPDSERERKERATRKKARVEVFGERSGNYALAGRELPVEEVLASKAHISGLAEELRAKGVQGSLRELELMCYLDLTQGRDPRDRIPSRDPDRAQDARVGQTGNSQGNESSHDGARAANGADTHEPLWQDSDRTQPGPGQPEDPDRRGRPWLGESGESDESGSHDSDWDDHHDDDGEPDDRDDDGGDEGGGGGGPWPFSPPGPGKPGGRAPFPAKINLLVPIGTLLGWSSMPGEAGREIIDPQTLRDLVQAASHHPLTRWGVTIIGQDKTATAHGYARGQHPWDPPPGMGRTRDGTTTTDHAEGTSRGCGHTLGLGTGKPPPDQADPAHASRARDGTPTAAQREQLGQLLDRLKADLEPIASGACDHRHREDRYRPSRALGDLVRARNATCPAPGCGASSFHSDLDHTRAWPDGDTDECNLGPPCRHHHRLKQAPGWELTQPEPGVFRWKAPSGRVYDTRPTKYDI